MQVNDVIIFTRSTKVQYRIRINKIDKGKVVQLTSLFANKSDWLEDISHHGKLTSEKIAELYHRVFAERRS